MNSPQPVYLGEVLADLMRRFGPKNLPINGNNDTHNKQGCGSNAVGDVPSGETAKRVNIPALIRSDTAAAGVGTENDAGLQAVTETGTAVATVNPATQTHAPSAAPIHFQNLSIPHFCGSTPADEFLYEEEENETPNSARTMNTTGQATLWFIWSNEHNAWWGANQRGYVQVKTNAGQYDFETACEICQSANRHSGQRPNETMLPVTFP